MRWRTHLRFEIGASVGQVSRATLRLWTLRRPRTALAVRQVLPARRLGAELGRWKPRSRSRRGRWVRIDVSSAVRGPGTVMLAVTGTHRAVVRLASGHMRQRSPLLIVQARSTGRPGAQPTLASQSHLGSPRRVPASDAEAAAHVSRSPFEPRPENAAANARMPTASELQAHRSGAQDWQRCSGHHLAVTGAFTGTTDEIIQWAAWKWGLETDLVRAVAAVESWWWQSAVGDSGESRGLMQIKDSSFPGAAPTTQLSTAFNVDVYGATIRTYYDGCATWLNSVPRGTTYAAGDLWGSVGAWYAGRWHTAPAAEYIARVRDFQARRVWASPDFVSGG